MLDQGRSVTTPEFLVVVILPYYWSDFYVLLCNVQLASLETDWIVHKCVEHPRVERVHLTRASTSLNLQVHGLCASHRPFPQNLLVGSRIQRCASGILTVFIVYCDCICVCIVLKLKQQQQQQNQRVNCDLQLHFAESMERSHNLCVV